MKAIKRGYVSYLFQVLNNLNKSGKQLFSLLLVCSLISSTIPQNVFASAGDGNENNINKNHIDFANALTAEELNKLGLPPGSIQTLNTSGVIADKAVDIDMIRGELPASQADKLVDILKELEPEMRKATEMNPNMKFQFVYVGPESEKRMSISAQEVLDILQVISPTTVKNEKIPDSLLAEYKELLHNFFYGTKHLFDKTSKSDVYWSLARVVGSGAGATMSFYYGSGVPLPASLMLGGGIIGAASGSVGLFLEKFTGWLENNIVTPQNARRYNRIGSIETYMFLSPILIGLQETGLNTLQGAELLTGGAALSVVVQNVYYFIKQRSPRAAMWYKWYATEALFLTAPFLAMPGFDIYSDNVAKAIIGTFITALMSTSSQGVWDILLTDYIRKPLLQDAIKKDLSNLSERISGTALNDENFSSLILNHKKNHIEEFKVRSKFKKFYYAASVVSVLSAIAMTTGGYKNIEWMQVAGKSGLIALGASGLLTWAITYIKNRYVKKSSTAYSATEGFKSSPILTCSSLFNM